VDGDDCCHAERPRKITPRPRPDLAQDRQIKWGTIQVQEIPARRPLQQTVEEALKGLGLVLPFQASRRRTETGEGNGFLEARKPDPMALLVVRYLIAFRKSNVTEMPML
jgi:hypothetical protein